MCVCNPLDATLNVWLNLFKPAEDLSSNSEAYASELFENLEEMFPQYYKEGDLVIRIQY